MRQSPIPELQANALALTGYLAARQTLEQSEPMFAAAEQFVVARGIGHDTAIMIMWARGAHEFYGKDLDEDEQWITYIGRRRNDEFG
jgi:hypothetical protein